MNTAYGVGLLAATAIVFAWAYGQYRRPQPRHWTKSEALTVTLTLFITALLSFGVSFLGTAVANFESETHLLEAAIVAGVSLVLCWFLVPRLMAPGRVAAEQVAELAVPPPANDPHPKTPSSMGGGLRNKRRAA
jgi:hypothetical protein